MVEEHGLPEDLTAGIIELAQMSLGEVWRMERLVDVKIIQEDRGGLCGDTSTGIDRSSLIFDTNKIARGGMRGGGRREEKEQFISGAQYAICLPFLYHIAYK